MLIINFKMCDVFKNVFHFCTKDKKKDDKKDEIQLEDLIERERAALNSVKFTRVTLESFLAWKKRKVKEKKEAIIKDEEKKRTDYKAGRQIGVCIYF